MHIPPRRRGALRVLTSARLHGALLLACREAGGSELVGYLVGNSLACLDEVEYWACLNYATGAQFVVSGFEAAAVERRAAERGLRVLALVHSHEGPPTPSALDRAAMARTSLPWLLVGMRDGEFAMELHELPLPRHRESG